MWLFFVQKVKCQEIVIEKIRFCYLSYTKGELFRLIFAEVRCSYSPKHGIPAGTAIQITTFDILGDRTCCS